MAHGRQYRFGLAICAMVEGFVISPASAAAPAASAVTLAPGSLQPPVAPACVSSPFGPRRLVGPHAATFHTGIDFPAPVGAVVRAVAPGQVVTIRRLGADGLEVDVKHDGADGGFVTRYAHLGTVVPALAEGRRDLAGGAPIGRVGRTGVTYGTHVHFEIRVHDQPIDPEPFFNVRRCQ